MWTSALYTRRVLLKWDVLLDCPEAQYDSTLIKMSADLPGRLDLSVHILCFHVSYLNFPNLVLQIMKPNFGRQKLKIGR